MGLDMYAYKTNENIPPVNFKEPDDATEIFYWRKHHDLLRWMGNLYNAKGGDCRQFNYDPVRLDAEDLDALEKDPDLRPNDLRFIECDQAVLETAWCFKWFPRFYLCIGLLGGFHCLH